MARARNIKPGFFKNEDLAECTPWARLCFAGLWTLADREGRLEDRPKRVKGELFPYDSVEVEPLLAELAQWGFIIRYQVDGSRFIQISKFVEHQAPHGTEKDGLIPDANGFLTVHERGRNGYATGTSRLEPYAVTVVQPVSGGIDNSALTVKGGMSEGGQNTLIPDSLIPDSLIPEITQPLPFPEGRDVIERCAMAASRSDAGSFHRDLVDGLKAEGWTVSAEHPVADRGDSRSGRIDVYVSSPLTIGIELDRQSIRAKSLTKLSQVAGHKVAILRDALQHAAVPGLDAVICCGAAVVSGNEEPKGFTAFWSLWPRSKRKEAKGECLKLWQQKGYEAISDVVLAHLQGRLNTDWTKQNCEFVEAPIVYLRKRPWEGAELAQAAPTAFRTGSDEYLRHHQHSAWWGDAGFGSVWEAANAQCWHSNAHKFRDGQRLPVEQEAHA